MIEAPNVTSLYVLLAFGICYWILKKFLFAPLSRILDAREKAEADAEKAYADSLRNLESVVARGEEQIALARREALKTREDLREKGLADLNAKLSEARAFASQAIDRASREIDEKAAALARTLPDRAQELARELSEKILGRKLVA